MSTPVYRPLQVLGAIDPLRGQCSQGTFVGRSGPSWPGDPDFGTLLHLHNHLPHRVWIAGIRSLNIAWEIVILSLGPVKGPFDAAAFNLDAVPGPPGGGHQPPVGESPRFCHYPMGFLDPGEKLPVRAVSYGQPSVPPVLNLLVFVEEDPDVQGD